LVGSRQAAELGARLILLVGLSDATVNWLTTYWALHRAENKLVQLGCARDLGIHVPKTQVTSAASLLSEELGDPVVLKPLGSGDFVQDGTYFTVYARAHSKIDPVWELLGGAPFLAQELVAADYHLRVVTVDDHAWAARLDARNLPLDWREDENAHGQWAPTNDPSVQSGALRLAERLSLGFSSQDWIVDLDGTAWFVDANPVGQWLFLPEAISKEVTRAVAEALLQRSGVSK
jgi:glutathione synthase/RimK-type ligase-like ATP-grasp enzyme